MVRNDQQVVERVRFANDPKPNQGTMLQVEPGPHLDVLRRSKIPRRDRDVQRRVLAHVQPLAICADGAAQTLVASHQFLCSGSQHVGIHLPREAQRDPFVVREAGFWLRLRRQPHFLLRLGQTYRMFGRRRW